MLTILLTTVLALQPATKPAAPEDAPETVPEMSADDAAMMEAYITAAEPGKEHKYLTAMAGDWKATTSYQSPGMPEPMTSVGTCTSQMVLGGRFLLEEFSGEMMGTPFKVISLTGYDKVTEKYQNLWIDEMSTSMVVSTGTVSDDGKHFTYQGKAADPVSGEMKPYEIEITVESNDKHVLEMHEPIGEDDKMVETFSIIYERA